MSDSLPYSWGWIFRNGEGDWYVVRGPLTVSPPCFRWEARLRCWWMNRPYRKGPVLRDD